MYQSSSESSIEHGNFPSVINLYAIGERAEPPATTAAPTKASTSSQTYSSKVKPVEPQAHNDPFLALAQSSAASSSSYPTTQLNDDEVSYASSSTYSISPTNAESPGINIPPMAPVSIVSTSLTAYAPPHDRKGSCGSPPSSDSESDCESTPRQRRRNSTTSTSTTSSDEDRPTALKARIWKGNSGASSAAKKLLHQQHQQQQQQQQHQLHQQPIVSQPSHRTAMNIIGSPSPSSNTVSSGGSVPGRHSLVSQFSSTTGRIETTLAENIAESIALQCAAVADSGISNTSPETQSSTEFQTNAMRSIETLASPMQPILAQNLLHLQHHQHLHPTGILKPGRDLAEQHNIMQAAFKASLFRLLSGIYVMLLCALGLLMPTAELLAKKVALHLFEGFYIYLYSVSLLFLIYVYAFLVREEAGRRSACGGGGGSGVGGDMAGDGSVAFLGGHSTARPSGGGGSHRRRFLVRASLSGGAGSFYLRLGAIGFGIVSMIRDGLTVATAVQHGSRLAECSGLALAVRPILGIIFTFVQLNFLFLNAKMCIHKYKALARFGLAHLIATNLCVWLRTVAKESVAEILAEPAKNSTSDSGGIGAAGGAASANVSLHRCASETGEVLKGLVARSDPYLFPTTVQYSLLAAAILWMTWRNVGRPGSRRFDSASLDSSPDGTLTSPAHQQQSQQQPPAPQSPPQARPSGSVEAADPVADTAASSRCHRRHGGGGLDCAGSHRGLFLGLAALVGGAVALLASGVLMQQPQYYLAGSLAS
ncbi:hypothetical protein BOX15_Mlig019121g2, partial [Macrostomum lignano]